MEKSSVPEKPETRQPSTESASKRSRSSNDEESSKDSKRAHKSVDVSDDPKNINVSDDPKNVNVSDKAKSRLERKLKRKNDARKHLESRCGLDAGYDKDPRMHSFREYTLEHVDGDLSSSDEFLSSDDEDGVKLLW